MSVYAYICMCVCVCVCVQAELSEMEHPLKGIEKNVSAVHMSTEEDLVHIRRGPVILYNLDSVSALGK